MIKLQNEQLTVMIDSKGAEIKRITSVATGLEYLHDGNPAYWGRTSPVLFPIVGSLAQGTYYHEDVAYQLSQHGFARDMVHEVVSQTQTSVMFSLKSTEETLRRYPFEFELRVSYQLEASQVTVSWDVLNPSDETMYFSIGAHPAFSTFGESLENYYLHFKDSDGIDTFLFDDKSGRVFEEKETIIEGLKLLPLSEGLFEEYPVLILDEESEITVASYEHDHKVTVTFEGFPYVGIWTPVNEGKAAPFICIEPWYGVADTVDAPQELKHKTGIQTLAPHAQFAAAYQMTFE